MKHFLSNKINICNRVNGKDIEYITRGKMYEVEAAYNTLGYEIDLSNGFFTFNNGELEYKHNNGQKELLSYLHLYDNKHKRLEDGSSTRISPSYVNKIDMSYYREQKLKELL